MAAAPPLIVEDLYAGNQPILDHAQKVFDADPEAVLVSFEVRYVEGDQKRSGELSDPDFLTVTREGNISA